MSDDLMVEAHRFLRLVQEERLPPVNWEELAGKLARDLRKAAIIKALQEKPTRESTLSRLSREVHMSHKSLKDLVEELEKEGKVVIIRFKRATIVRLKDGTTGL